MDEQFPVSSPGIARGFSLPMSILVAGILISGSIIYAVGSKNTQTSNTILSNTIPTQTADAVRTLLPHDVVLGDAKAPVTVVEYGDYQCPFCGKFFRTIESVIRDKYVRTGKVKLIFRNFQFLGPESSAAGAAAECAREQGQFWGYHDALYWAEIVDGQENNGNLNSELFTKLAKDLSLNLEDFFSCVSSGRGVATVAEETQGGYDAGANAAPTVFVNKTQIRGLADNDLRVLDAINAALNTK